MVILRMIRWFVYYLQNYERFIRFLDSRPVLKQRSVMSGEYANCFSSRWRYALTMTLILWKHRDRYGWKCRRIGGNCAKCKEKHC